MLFTDTDIMTNIIKMLLQTLLLYQFSELTSGRSLQSSEGGCWDTVLLTPKFRLNTNLAISI